MKRFDPTPRLRHLAAALGLIGALLGAVPARAQANPDFDAVAWTAIGCPAADLTADTSPGSANFVGDATYPAAYYAFDASYLYFRYRMDRNPASAGGFDQYVWTALMQVPSGNPFQYQYQLSLNGKDDTIEIWANTVAQDIEFSPLFQDDSEVQLFSQPYDLANGSTVNTTPLARSLATGDGSDFGNDADYFLDFAFPVATLVGNGAIADASELGDSFFFPATSTTASSYNKGHLNCSFLPTTDLAVDKVVDPGLVPANALTPLTYSIAVFNTGGASARGLVLNDIALPAYMGNVVATVTSDDPSVTWTVDSENPLEVRIPVLPVGAYVMVELSADAMPTCADADFMNVATATATNAMEDTDTALLDVQTSDGFELCDGADNDCDGTADEGTDVLCSDGDACNGAETCGGASGCVAGTPPSCDDANACTIDSCDALAGCMNTPTPGCMPCSTPADCNDGNACTTESCTAGVCDPSTPIPGCVPCTTTADCPDDANACTDATCDAGVCGTTAIPGCVPCVSAGDCEDQNACTTDTCPAGACMNDAQPGCIPCDTDADCNDGGGCTTDTCTAGMCSFTAVPGCVPCTTAADCGDGDSCSDDVCSADGVCGHQPRPGCVPCTTDADCGDGDDCTIDQCGDDGSCAFSTIPRCPLVPEQCSDGVDNDDDTAVDCEDSDCAGDPACPAEVCGNCADDDGDGLVDYEDTDCCAAPAELAVRRVMMKPTAKVRGNRLNLRVRSARFSTAGFDPSTQDTTLQISDADGQIFCQTVTAPNWKHRKRVFRFRDKKNTFAGGLKKGKFKVKRNGQIVFRTRGKKVVLRPMAAGPVRVTLRVGTQCAQSTTLLRPKRKALVFP